MGLFDKATDKLLGLKYENIEYEQMLRMVQEYFIKDADDNFLKKVKSTSKGGFLRGWITKLDSSDNRFRLVVDPKMGSFMIWIMGKDVSLVDKEEKKDYMISSRKWKKFYTGILKLIEEERTNRIK